MIKLPILNRDASYEAELAFIVKDGCRNVSRADAFKHILGYTCMNECSLGLADAPPSGGRTKSAVGPQNCGLKIVDC